MNKLIKGSIAGAAGIALLLGGAGTLASWNSTASAGGAATITAGTLDVVASTTAGTWTVTRGTASPVAVSNIATFKIVPGDKLTHTKSFTVTATGDNLQGTVSLTGGAITGTTGTGAAGTALATFLTKAATFTVNGAAGSTFTAATGTQPVVVATTIDFANGIAGAENAAKGGAVSLTDFSVTVSQTN